MNEKKIDDSLYSLKFIQLKAQNSSLAIICSILHTFPWDFPHLQIGNYTLKPAGKLELGKREKRLTEPTIAVQLLK